MDRRRTAAVAIACVWCVAVLVVLYIVVDTTIGPVVLDFGHGLGVHVGDLVGLALAAFWAGLATIELIRWSRRPDS